MTMMKAVGGNLPMGAGDDPHSPRLDFVGSARWSFLRAGQIPPSSAQAIFQKQKARVVPVIGSAGAVVAYVDSLHDASGNLLEGQSGMVSAFNESNGAWSGIHFPNGGAMAAQIVPVWAKVQEKHPHMLLAINATAPGYPNGGSTPGDATWLKDFWTWCHANGYDPAKIVGALEIHMYTRGLNVLQQANGAYTIRSWPGTLVAVDKFLVDNNATNIGLYIGECGIGEGGTDVDVAQDDNGQKLWYTQAAQVLDIAETYAPHVPWILCAPYCYISAQPSSHDDGAFFVRQLRGWSDGPTASPVKDRPAKAVWDGMASKYAGADTLLYDGVVGTVPVPKTPPTIAWKTAPNAASIVVGAQAFEVTADDDSGVLRVEFKLDGKLLSTEGFAPWVCNGDGNTWDSRTVPDGDHVMQATVFANDGGTAAVTVAFSTDNVADPTPPKLTMTHEEFETAAARMVAALGQSTGQVVTTVRKTVGVEIYAKSSGAELRFWNLHP